MPHSSAKLLQDILDAGRAVRQFVANHTLAEYRENLMLRSAVERQLEIVGEAMNRLDRADPDMLQRLEGHGRIIAFRNIIAHGYDVLDQAIVWQVITDYLPSLLNQTEQLLQEVEADNE